MLSLKSQSSAHKPQHPGPQMTLKSRAQELDPGGAQADIRASLYRADVCAVLILIPVLWLEQAVQDAQPIPPSTTRAQ